MTTTPESKSPAPDDGLLPTRIGGILGLVAFAYTLLSGLFDADNPFSTIVVRAIIAMVGTLIVGYFLGWMAQMMLNENIRSEAKKKAEEAENSANSIEGSATDGR